MTKDQALKLTATILNGDSPLEAVQKLFPTLELGEQSKLAVEFPTSDQYNEALEEINKDPEAFLPSKLEFTSLLWRKMNSVFISNDDLAKIAKVYSEVRGYTGKSGEQGASQVNNNRTIVVYNHGSDEDWEKQLRKQQEGLQNGNVG